ncbi:hypothetical protein LPJ61_007111 [Coemansia biformis]|uniref:ADF-H domain-containing protein n=1 Tax=Coemansia biformis TaxID=1286918 RepID=A0A9W7XTG2_9FUNG|nr:hypothetical protein LPJ61_007111 [Coemansia biformis]
MLQLQTSSPVNTHPPGPSFCKRPLVPTEVLNNTSAYKYAVFDLDGLQGDAYAPGSVHGDAFASLRSLLPADRCCYAVYRLTFIREMRPISAVIFYTWVPADAPPAEQQRYLLQAESVAGQLSHYDFRVTCSEWREFQQSAAASRARMLTEHHRRRGR